MCISFTKDPFLGEPDGALAHLVGEFNGALTEIDMVGSSIGKGTSDHIPDPSFSCLS